MKQIVKNNFSIICLIIFIVTSLVFIFFLRQISENFKNKNKLNYLVSLRENSTIGCSTFWEQKTDIMVFGDSHSYAAFDFLRLSQLANTPNISTCTMGGLYFEAVVDMVRKITQQRVLPKLLIYGLSLRQFTNGSDKEQQLKEHHKLLDDSYIQSRFPFAEIRKNLEVRFLNQLDSDLVRQRELLITKWAPVISALDDYDVNDSFATLNNQSKDLWIKYLAQLQFQDTLRAQLVDFCNLLRQHQLKLILVDIPESPYLKSLYKADQLEKYSEVIFQLSKCSLKTVSFSYKEWGLKSAHFVNRNMNDSWDMSEIKLKGNSLTGFQLENAFDLDHMNLVGSQLFTEKVFRSIEKELTNAL